MSSDDRQLSEELSRVAARRQIALVRSLADALDDCLSASAGDDRAPAMHAQLLEELARLGCRALEAAAAAVPRTDESAVRLLRRDDRA
jgi:hypothetical protein